MNKFERQNLILDQLRGDQTVSVEEFSRILNVSAPTIRRDLKELSAKNLILRYYGGASLHLSDEIEPPIFARAHLNREKKRQIGLAAAGLVQDGETIYLSGGTTTVEVAKNLNQKKNLTIITSAINVINVLVKYPNISVIVPGGSLIHDHLTLVGPIARKSFEDLRADKAIMGVSAIDIKEGITSETLIDAETDRAIIEFAPVVIVVCDSSKLGLRRAARVAPVSVVQYIVTDSDALQPDIEALRSMNLNVIVTSSTGDKSSSNMEGS